MVSWLQAFSSKMSSMVLNENWEVRLLVTSKDDEDEEDEEDEESEESEELSVTSHSLSVSSIQ